MSVKHFDFSHKFTPEQKIFDNCPPRPKVKLILSVLQYISYNSVLQLIRMLNKQGTEKQTWKS